MYTGKWREGRRHGQGTLTLTGKAGTRVFTGEWKNGLIEGQGELVIQGLPFAHITKYEGAFDVGEFAPEELDAYQALITEEETASGRHITVMEAMGRALPTAAQLCSLSAVKDHGLAGKYFPLEAGRQQCGLLPDLALDLYSQPGNLERCIVPSDHGWISYSDGTTYGGSFMRAGIPDGKGRATAADGTYYEGAWSVQAPQPTPF